MKITPSLALAAALLPLFPLAARSADSTKDAKCGELMKQMLGANGFKKIEAREKYNRECKKTDKPATTTTTTTPVATSTSTTTGKTPTKPSCSSLRQQLEIAKFSKNRMRETVLKEEIAQRCAKN